ncbi:hypothetical protein V5O48_012136 [Marasmius crinis-equi]|uniref:DUF1308 domain-containing protein n=1 Tax=Marasmius crinis-equi TaxID=585013 RepID=A0ABR3F3Q9_9AGAR
MSSPASHPELRQLRLQLQSIHDSIIHFQPPVRNPPILDSALEVIQNPNQNDDKNNNNNWLHHENIPGLKKLKDTIRVDLDVLDKFLEDPESIHLPALSTNAPYLIAVWNEVLCAPEPVTSVFKGFPLVPPDPSTTQARTRTKKELRTNQNQNQPRQPEAKVDVVADHKRRWIRVNTIKNTRLLAEFREIDSYLTSGSDSDSSPSSPPSSYRPTLAQKEFDNSLLRMGRSLIAASKANPLLLPASPRSPSTLVEVIPRVTLRLTRLDPEAEDELNDERIARTIRELEGMGVEVELGERRVGEVPRVPVRIETQKRRKGKGRVWQPTEKINLDLSALIALVSDLTHASLPTSIEEANRRFVPPQKYLEWKRKMTASKARARKMKTNGEIAAEIESGLEQGGGEGDEEEELPYHAQQDLAKHSRALTNQVLQEMGKGLLQELRDRLPSPSTRVEFWTTREARDRCLRIVEKIGGVGEKRRVRALLWEEGEKTREEAEEAYWKGSRFGRGFIPLIPIRIHDDEDSDGVVAGERPRPAFFQSLDRTCSDILASENSHPSSHPTPIARATPTKTNPRLTAHTVQSMLSGARLGWTTLTANRTSVKAIVREMAGRERVVVFGDGEVLGGAGGGGWVGDEGQREEDEDEDGKANAAIWIIDPRSLAEGMRSDSEGVPEVWGE